MPIRPTMLLCALLTAPFATAPRDVAEAVRTLLAQRDDAEPALIEELSTARTREAAEGLVAAYDAMSSVLMQREVVRALPPYDTVEDAAQFVLQKLTDVATTAPEPELHEAAIDALGECAVNGPDFLRRIVDSSAEDVVRVRAMRRLIALDPDGEPSWYRAQFEKVAPQDDKDLKRKIKSGDKIERIDALTELRELALERIAPDMKESELMDVARDKEKDQFSERKDGLRRIALLDFERRGGGKAIKLAEQVFEDKTETPENRALGAQVLARLTGDKHAQDFVDVGLKDPSITPDQLASTRAELVSGMRSAKLEKSMQRDFAKERESGQRFILAAMRGSADEKLYEAAVPLLDASDARLAAEAARWLGASGKLDALAPLQGALDRTRQPSVASAVLRAIGALRDDPAAWTEELRALTGDKRSFVRNAALEELATQDARMHEDLFATAVQNEDWTTRKVALEALLASRSKAATAAIVGRIGDEEGLMLHRFADALWQLSGKPFRTNPKAWQSWWKDEGEAFEPIGLDELETLRAEEERRRLAQTTRANSFFGIRVISHRVIFILDVSGSMEERLRTKYLGEEGETRLQFAQREMIAAIERLEKGTFFNLVTFSNDTDSWTPSGMSLSTPENLASAVAYAEKMRPGGGTNLHGALRAAFNDPEVDTIFVLSDGEPSMGRITDPWGIRNEVLAWNENRGVVINAISVGGKYRILEWLALDSGGVFTQVR
ncbi:MAG TPA: VWA domain-containing protein [Planctomycetota bacterium]|nr:VWA domain-containing protein [Planctomycetota bacterium]